MVRARSVVTHWARPGLLGILFYSFSLFVISALSSISQRRKNGSDLLNICPAPKADLYATDVCQWRSRNFSRRDVSIQSPEVDSKSLSSLSRRVLDHSASTYDR